MNEYIQIVNQYKEGDEKAFKVLFDHFISPCRYFMQIQLLDVTIAEDMIQDTFIRMWEKRRQIESFDHFKSYLYRSLYNNINQYRSRKKKVVDVNEVVIQAEYSLFDTIVEVELWRLLEAEISKLPRERRRIIALALEGKRMNEIADELGVSINTVKSQKRKALSTLRERLDHITYLYLIFYVVSQ